MNTNNNYIKYTTCPFCRNQSAVEGFLCRNCGQFIPFTSNPENNNTYNQVYQNPVSTNIHFAETNNITPKSSTKKILLLIILLLFVLPILLLFLFNLTIPKSNSNSTLPSYESNIDENTIGGIQDFGFTPEVVTEFKGTNVDDVDFYVTGSKIIEQDNIQYVVYTISIKNLGNQTYNISPSQFKATSQDETLETSELLNNKYSLKSIKNAAIFKGESITRNIVYQLPERSISDLSDVKLMVKSNYSDDYININ